MPKEYVGAEPQEHGSVKVVWGRDHQQIQIAVAGPVGWRDSTLRQPEIDPDDGLDWHFSVMHRSEINSLIRVLRKARDQAFGADA